MPHRRTVVAPRPDTTPRPLACQVLYERSPRGRVSTTIARTWLMQDIPSCQLCNRCTATVGRMGVTALCLQKINRHIPEEQAELFGDATGMAGSRRPGEGPAVAG